MCSQNKFFDFRSDGMEFFDEKLENRIRYPISQKKEKKRLYSFLSSDAQFPQKGPCPPKIFFAVILENIDFFEEKIAK